MKCVLCSCNNRSKDCDGESGVCEDCRLSTGDHCETCGYGVDLATGCTQCSPEYWHPDIAKEEKRCRGMSGSIHIGTNMDVRILFGIRVPKC